MISAAEVTPTPPPVRRPAARQPSGMAVQENRATPPERIRAAKDFKVELLYSVPSDKQGSWVNMCLDNKGRIIVSDQYGGLYRFAAPAPGKELDPATIEPIPAKIRAANGLLWAFDSLYVMVNDYEKKMESGLYRLSSSSQSDDRLDQVEKIHGFQASGDHGTHAILLSPDKKSLFLVTGDSTIPSTYTSTRVPPYWGEDHLLPRMPDGRGFMRDVMAPGGIIYKVSPDGKEFEVYSSGYRNIFDAAFNNEGELFTYDADMEYDFNTPWYRPTRICHVVSGSEYGWRNGAGKWPEWYPDSLPPVLNIGPGSPTGTTFGYGARFPAAYQNALFALDWSWGKVYAVKMVPRGSSYVATKEEFLSGSPLPVTDVIINPADGAMYFTIGGRKVQSGIYRVTYTGAESTAPATIDHTGEKARALRHKLEAFHGHTDPAAVKESWKYLDHEDPFIRTAARVAIEHQPVSQWSERALKESNPEKQVQALLALTRTTGIDRFHRKPTDAPIDKAMQAKILAALQNIRWSRLNNEERITLVRDYQICLNRFERPDDATVEKIINKLDSEFPAPTVELNRVLCETLVYLQSPNVAAKAVNLLNKAPTQQEQMEYARSLRMLKTGWTDKTHTEYFEWFLKAANYKGGASFEKFVENIKNDAVASLSDKEKAALKTVIERKAEKKSPLEVFASALAGRTMTHEWTLDELSAASQGNMKKRSFDNGKRMFGAVGCFACHRFANEGGMTGPDLTGAGGRYSVKDFLDQVINPSKEINEQFVPVVLTKTNGDTVTGVIVNLNNDTVMINTDPASPNEQTTVDRKQVKSIERSKVSPMPEGLLNILTREEILDLAAFVLSGGDAKNSMFK
ncbi:MAG: heme-binding protein [Verrucomicrobiales bacterium]|nr:heme-binding protein [Verrucomicrobiales bacterium]